MMIWTVTGASEVRPKARPRLATRQRQGSSDGMEPLGELTKIFLVALKYVLEKDRKDQGMGLFTRYAKESEQVD
jgi:hypothetical protein